ncbi:MAG: metal ABC transporter substrate-binding protein [Xanthobacteraceae bacterium]
MRRRLLRQSLCAILGGLSFCFLAGTPAALTAAFAHSCSQEIGRACVVTTTSELASLATATLGDLAHVESIIPSGADPEGFEPRPSDLAKLKDARMLVRVGLGYDHWLERLISLHGNASVKRGGPGYVDVSRGIPLLEVKGRSLDPTSSDGHAHGQANPHYWLDPANAELITAAIAEAMIRLDESTSTKVIAQRDDFLNQLSARLQNWERMLLPYRGAPLVAYHNTWPYFARRFRLDIVDVIESKEGVSPSPSRLARLAALMRERGVRVIVHEPFAPSDVSELLARRTGATLVRLSPSVGSPADVADYSGLFDYNVDALVRSLAATPD